MLSSESLSYRDPSGSGSGVSRGSLVPDLEALHSGRLELVGGRVVADGAHRTRRMHVPTTRDRYSRFKKTVVGFVDENTILKLHRTIGYRLQQLINSIQDSCLGLE